MHKALSLGNIKDPNSNLATINSPSINKLPTHYKILSTLFVTIHNITIRPNPFVILFATPNTWFLLAMSIHMLKFTLKTMTPSQYFKYWSQIKVQILVNTSNNSFVSTVQLNICRTAQNPRTLSNIDSTLAHSLNRPTLTSQPNWPPQHILLPQSADNYQIRN